MYNHVKIGTSDQRCTLTVTDISDQTMHITTVLDYILSIIYFT